MKHQTAAGAGSMPGVIFTLMILFTLCARAQTAVRDRILLDSDWRFHRNELDGNSTVTPGGMSLTQWVWIADDNAPYDASTMAAPGLDTSTWTEVTPGTDVFNGRVGYAWFRTAIVPTAFSGRPLTLHFLGVDDNATVYLNGTLIGQHAGWSEAFDVSLDPAWIDGGTNVLAVAVQNTGGIGGIMGDVLLQSGLQFQPPGMPVTDWIWTEDDNAPDDADAMAAPTLDTSAWSSVKVGTDVFNGRSGAAWFRASLDALALSGRPLALHFLNVDDDASVYLNGVLVGRHTGPSQPFDLSPLDPAWNPDGPNVLAVAVQNTAGAGGILGSVILQSGSQIQPPGTSVNGWVYMTDDNATNDAATMTATNLDTTLWQTAGIGQDVFSNHVGFAWFRAALDPLASSGRPLTLHFLGVNDNASVYLNGVLIGQHSGSAQPFDISPLDPVWNGGGPNILAVAVQNTGGAGGILKPVLLQSGEDIQDLSPTGSSFDDSAWRVVQLPHDYVVEGTFTPTADASHGSLPLATAWYRKTFTLPASAEGHSIWVDFDGVYHNAMVWINGHYLGKWHSGYAAFRFDISPYAVCGGTNVLAVHVDPHGSEGWWYEGGGIYRHVWLNIANPLHIAPWGTFIASNVQGPDTNGDASALLTITTTLTNAAAQDQTCSLASQLVGPDGVSAGTTTSWLTVPGGTATNVEQLLEVANARLWSVDTPQLYQLQSTVQVNGQTVDDCTTPFGIRSIRYDVNDGFFLNGKPVKLKGTCNHQDFAGVGIGMPDTLLYWRIKKLKEMGSNAYRCSHNPPTAALLDACDRLGMLVMDETRHLGDATGQKSDASTPYSDLSELNSMILRDRNHPSIIMWSMCNEEFGVQGTQAGADMFYAMKQRVRQFDTTRPITCAMNGDWGTGITLVEDLQGCNYNPGGYDSFHAAFPSLPMFGSETASGTTDRGVYANDSSGGYVSAYNSTAEDAWQPVATRPFVAGAFIWTGFDYKGEPSPYGWPCVNSHFGVMDMCGLPKDSYYYYQAWWGTRPLVHIFPHWNQSTLGQNVSVWCFANTETVELFLNGVSQGVQPVTPYRHVSWSVPYLPGTLLVKGYNGGVLVASNEVSTTGAPASLRLGTDRTYLSADGEDVTVVYASVLDALGRVVPTASNLVTFSTQGAGFVAGVGNGDPSSHEPDKDSQRRAFNGWCMALVGATTTSGPITLAATSPGLASATLNLQSNGTNDPPAAPGSPTAEAGDTRVSLRWGLSFRADSYHIKRAIVSGGPYAIVANDTAIAFTDSGLTNGTTYYYVVSAVNANGESADSAEVSVTPTRPAPPPAPQGVTAQRDDAQVNLSWDTSAGAISYEIKRSAIDGGPYSLVATTTSTSYADTGLTNGTTYYYVISAANAGGNSPDSGQAEATPASMQLLVGTIIGTTGSWNNSGNTREKAMDGNLSTFFDAPTGDGDWVGLDLGTNTTRMIAKIRFSPRIGYASRMAGGMFQGANTAGFSDAVTLHTLAVTPPDGKMTTLILTNTTAFRYMRYLAPPGGYGNVAEVEFYTVGVHVSQLTGSIIGTSGSWNNDGNTKEKAMDGDLTTFFDAPTPDGDWVGLDLGSAKPITNVRYCPRSGSAARMIGGVFEGANADDFSDATVLFTITDTPPDATLTAQAIVNSSSYRYVRYLAPPGAYGNVAEIQFFSTAPGQPPVLTAPTGLVATPGHEQVQLSWTGNPAATNYIVKRSVVSGGPYTSIATSTAVRYMDSGLPAGTYYYVVSAVSAAGVESPNSAEAETTLTCEPPATPVGLAATAEHGRVTVMWSASSGATRYNVLRATNVNGPFELLVANGAATSYTDVAAPSGGRCYYIVQALNDCGASADSTAVGITPLEPAKLGIALSGSQLALSWPTWFPDYRAYMTTNLSPPTTWEPVTNLPQSSDGWFLLKLPTSNADHGFFRLALP